MKLTKQGQEVIEKLHLISGFSRQDVRTFFESLLIYVIFGYLDDKDKKIILPFIGDLSINYIKDEYEGDIKKAVLDLYIKPDDNLRKNIGQAVDGDKTDIEEIFKKRIHDSLDNHVENSKKG